MAEAVVGDDVFIAHLDVTRRQIAAAADAVQEALG